MLTTILVLLIVLWLLGMVSSVHARRVHPHPARARNRRRADSRDSGPTTRLTGRYPWGVVSGELGALMRLPTPHSHLLTLLVSVLIRYTSV